MGVKIFTMKLHGWCGVSIFYYKTFSSFYLCFEYIIHRKLCCYLYEDREREFYIIPRGGCNIKLCAFCKSIYVGFRPKNMEKFVLINHGISIHDYNFVILLIFSFYLSVSVHIMQNFTNLNTFKFKFTFTLDLLLVE